MVNPRITATLVTSATAVLLLGGLGFAATGVAAATTAAVSTSWAYGATTNHTATWSNATGGYTGSIQAFFGWHVILTQFNTSATTFEVEVQRTIGLDYAVQYCRPSCLTPSGEANATFHAWEQDVGFVNFTTNGTTYVAGAPVPALAVENSSDAVEANLSASYATQLHLLGQTRLSHYDYSVTLASHVAASFTPALGLVPQPLGSATAWNSTSAFAASGGWAGTIRSGWTTAAGASGNTSLAPSGQAQANGTVELFGQLLGDVTLDDGVTTQAIGFALAGPFHLREGLLLVPAEADLFDGASSSYAAASNATAATTTSADDLGGPGGHFGLLATAASYTPSSSANAVGGVTPADTNGGTVLQAQPESVTQAQSGMPCLQQGNCPGPTGSAGSVLRPGTLVFAGLVGLIVGLIAAAAVVSRRRDIPPPPHPNASLYPPGPAGASASPRAPTGPGKSPAAPPTGESSDPLGHLW